MSLKELGVSLPVKFQWLLVPLLSGIAVANPIKPNRQWLDTRGWKIHAHAAGFVKDPRNGRYYWYGESKKFHVPNDVGGVNCYSAESMAGPWVHEGKVLRQSDIKVPGVPGPYIVERPKVLFNNGTEQFVMWFHLDIPESWVYPTGSLPANFLSGSGGDGKAEKYIFHRAAVAVSKNATGPFTLVDVFKPDGLGALDMNMFVDPLDGEAYLIRDCDHRFIGISRLTKDFLNTTGIISKIPTSEGMAMFRLKNGTYYVLSSHLTGWSPNPMIAWRSNITKLEGAGWEELPDPTNNPTSFNSQPTAVFEYTPANGGDPYFVYVGDDWVNCKAGAAVKGDIVENLPHACYVWLPIKLDGERAPIEIDYFDEWDMEDLKRVQKRFRRQRLRTQRALGVSWLGN